MTFPAAGPLGSTSLLETILTEPNSKSLSLLDTSYARNFARQPVKDISVSFETKKMRRSATKPLLIKNRTFSVKNQKVKVMDLVFQRNDLQQMDEFDSRIPMAPIQVKSFQNTVLGAVTSHLPRSLAGSRCTPVSFNGRLIPRSQAARSNLSVTNKNVPTERPRNLLQRLRPNTCLAKPMSL